MPRRVGAGEVIGRRCLFFLSFFSKIKSARENDYDEIDLENNYDLDFASIANTPRT
jgi:hypothetical protein